MLIGNLALVAASAFAGIAFYITVAEHPARLGLDERAMLAEWTGSYPRAAGTQVPLALIGTALGIWSYVETSNWCWLIGAVALLAAIPYTLIVMMGTNKGLLALGDDAAPGSARALMETWGRQHALRIVMSAVAVAFFLSASLRSVSGDA